MIEFRQYWANPDTGEAGTVKGRTEPARPLAAYKLWPPLDGEVVPRHYGANLVRGAMAQVAFQDLTGLRPTKWPMSLYRKFGRYPLPVLHFRPDHGRTWVIGKGAMRRYLLTDEPYDGMFSEDQWNDPARYADWARGWNFHVFARGIGLWNPHREAPIATRFVLCSPPEVGVDLAEICERLKAFPYFDEFEVEHTPLPFPDRLRRSA